MPVEQTQKVLRAPENRFNSPLFTVSCKKKALFLFHMLEQGHKQGDHQVVAEGEAKRSGRAGCPTQWRICVGTDRFFSALSRFRTDLL